MISYFIVNILSGLLLTASSPYSVELDNLLTTDSEIHKQIWKVDNVENHVKLINDFYNVSLGVINQDQLGEGNVVLLINDETEAGVHNLWTTANLQIKMEDTNLALAPVGHQADNRVLCLYVAGNHTNLDDVFTFVKLG